MEKSRFFNSTVDDIREYNANDFAEYFERGYSSGVYREGGQISLRCTVNGSDMNTTISIGSAMIRGYMYLIKESPLVLTHDTAHATYDRIDRVVLRLDLNDNARNIKAFILKGVPNENPQAPSLTRDSLIYEISLAQVLIKANSATISRNNIKDERMDRKVCGVVSSQLDSQYLNLMDYTMEVTDFDENELPVEVSYYNNGILFEKTRLSDKNINDKYTKLTLYKYLEDGETIGHVKEYTLTYNDNGQLIKQELVVG